MKLSLPKQSIQILDSSRKQLKRTFSTNPNHKLIIREKSKHFYLDQNTQEIHIVEPKESIAHRKDSIVTEARNFAFRFFLPAGYPKTVHSDYPKFYGWAVLQGISGSASYVLSTQSLLTAIGIGQELALPGGAAISWVLKDGLGSMGMMLLASKFGTRFDIDTKRTKWRADILHNIGVGLELITPFVPRYFLILASLANVAKGLAGLTSGATRAALNKHFSKSENLGDITAKAQTQGIATYLIGMCCGIGLSTLPWNNPGSFSVFITYGILASVHIYASYRALSSVSLSTLNNQRSSLLISQFIQNLPLSTPEQLKYQDFLITTPFQVYKPKIIMGSTIADSVSSINQLPFLVDVFKDEKYIANIKRNSVCVLLKDKSETSDMMKAYFNAYVLYNLYKEEPLESGIKLSLEYTNKNFHLFVKELQNKQWNTSQYLLFYHDHKVSFS